MGQGDEENRISDDEYRAFLASLAQTLADARTAATAGLSSEERSMSWEQQYVLGIYIRCLGLYDACCDLIANGHVEAALIVGRSLLIDSLSLRYMARHPALLKQNVAKWVRKSTLEEISLAKAAKSVGLPDADANLRSAQKDLHELDSKVEGLPMSKGTLPNEQAMARAVSDLEAYWEIKFCSNLVHPTEMGFGRLMQKRDGTIIAEAFVSPLNLQFAAFLFIDALFDACEAVAKLLGLQLTDDFAESRSSVLTEIKKRQTEAMKLMGISQEDGGEEVVDNSADT